MLEARQVVEEDDATAHRMVDINVHGVMYGMKLALPRMQRRNSGHLVNLASQAGKGGFPGGATYCGTKHFVVGVSEAVRAELADTEIEISVVMPFGVPIPPSPDTSIAILAAFEARGITFVKDSLVKALDPERRVAVLSDGREMPCALFLGVPVHRVPQVVVE